MKARLPRSGELNHTPLLVLFRRFFFVFFGRRRRWQELEFKLPVENGGSARGQGWGATDGEAESPSDDEGNTSSLTVLRVNLSNGGEMALRSRDVKVGFKPTYRAAWMGFRVKRAVVLVCHCLVGIPANPSLVVWRRFADCEGCSFHDGETRRMDTWHPASACAGDLPASFFRARGSPHRAPGAR